MGSATPLAPVSSFRLMHRATSAVLAGYVVLSATQDEINHANSRLREAGSEYRYVNAQILQQQEDAAEASHGVHAA